VGQADGSMQVVTEVTFKEGGCASAGRGDVGLHVPYCWVDAHQA